MKTFFLLLTWSARPASSYGHAHPYACPYLCMHAIRRCKQVYAMLLALLLGLAAPAWAAKPQFSQAAPEKRLSFPHDFGAHPSFRTEWWYVTGWLQTPSRQPLGFQITFFRSAGEHDAANPSRFAPRQLIIAHAALSDPAYGKLRHEQKIAREGFGLAYAKEGNTDLKIDDWHLVRTVDGRYRAAIRAQHFQFSLTLIPTQPPLLQGEQGFSRKGGSAGQASHYYSEPHLQVKGEIVRNGKPVAVDGTAWLDHEWSTSMLAENASGWDWVGINLENGSALMAFQIRGKNGEKLWAHAALRDAEGRMRQFKPEEVHFSPQRHWRSPRTNASYPVATLIHTAEISWQITPLLDDQELDSRQSTGSVYWEGAVTVTRNGVSAGRGYLEMTGYAAPLKL